MFFPHKLGFKKLTTTAAKGGKHLSLDLFLHNFAVVHLAGGWTMAVPPFMDGLWWKKNGKHQLRWNGISNDFEEININILIHRNCRKKPKNQHVDHWMAAICWCLVLNMAECRFWTCAVRNRNQSNGRIWARWNPFRSSWELPLVGGVWF